MVPYSADSTVSALNMFTLGDLESAADIVYQHMPPTPQYRWPLLCQRTGCEVWVKHEHHNPTGAFKVRGGLTYLHYLRMEQPDLKHIIAATRGNHGQSVAYAAQKYGFKSTIVVPYGNNPDKNRSMIGWGAELIKYGQGFEEALAYAQTHAQDCHMHFVPSFDFRLILGVASYCLEFLKAVPDLDTVYVPIGKGSGICSMIAARDALGLRTQVVGVVSENAPAYALSFKAGHPVETPTADTLADGVACRIPEPTALEWIMKSVDRIVTVSDEAVLKAIGAYLSDTHNLAEGAGAIGLAALMKEADYMRGRKVGLVLCGGNVDHAVLQQALPFMG